MKRRSGKRAWLLAAGYAAALTAASLLPSGGAGPLSGWDTAISPGLQNLLHVPAYGVLVWLLLRATGRGAAFGVAALAAVAATAWGAGLEAVQAAIPGRFGSLEDALLNAAGAAAVALAMPLVGREPRRRSEPAASGGPQGPDAAEANDLPSDRVAAAAADGKR